MLLGIVGGIVGGKDDSIDTVFDNLYSKGHSPVIVTSALGSTGRHVSADCIFGLVARLDGVVFCNIETMTANIVVDQLVQSIHDNNIPYWIYPAIPEMHPTEVSCPKQVDGFINTVMCMYRVHLDKNQDYSPQNMLGTGEVGAVVRLWDKIARLMNLTGFRFEISKSWFEKPKTPKNESVMDSYTDLSNYGIIGQLLIKGVWGK